MIQYEIDLHSNAKAMPMRSESREPTKILTFFRWYSGKNWKLLPPQTTSIQSLVPLQSSDRSLKPAGRLSLGKKSVWCANHNNKRAKNYNNLLT
jgi:hypothetical protein